MDALSSPRRLRLLAVWALTVFAVGVAMAAGGRGDGSPAAPGAHVAAPASVTRSTTPFVPDPATSSSAGPATTAPAPASGDTPAVLGEQVGSDPGPDASPAPAAPSTTEDPTDAATRQSPLPGSYPSTTSGSASLNGSPQSIPRDGALVVEEQGGDLHLQVPSGPAHIDLVLHYSPTSADLVSFTLSAAGISKTFEPAAGSPFFRFDVPPGTTWSWAADSTDGLTHLEFVGSVTRSDVVAMNGGSYPADVVDAALTLSGDVVGSAHLTTWVSAIDRLTLIQHQQIDATSSMFGFSSRFVSDTVTTLTRSTP